MVAERWDTPTLPGAPALMPSCHSLLLLLSGLSWGCRKLLGGDGVYSSEQGPGARPRSLLTRVSVQTGCPWGGGAGAVVHMSCDWHGRLCRGTRGTEGGTAAPAALRRQVRDFAPIGKAGPPAGNKNTRRGVTSGNAYPRSRSSPIALSCYPPLPCPAPAPQGTPAQGWECATPSVQTDGEQPPSARRSHPQGGTETCPVTAGKHSPSGRQSHHQPACPLPFPQLVGFLENQLPESPSNWVLPSAALQTNP